MDIRIGNDIRIDVTLQNLGISSVADIDSVKCVLLKECTHKDARSNKPFCYPSKYTIGCCGAPVYNVYPYNITAQYFHTAPNCFMASCLHCNSGCQEVEIEAYVSEQDSKVHMCYRAAQQLCGEYALVLSVTVKEDSWNSDGKHTCSFGYGKIFRIVKDVFGKCGTIIINLPKCDNYDIDGVALGRFESDKCTITAIPDNEERGYTTGSGEYRHGQAVKLTAVNYELYTFACWDDGERSAARIVTAKGDATYTALFSDGTEYTVYFYDEDKSTELARYQLTYGSVIPVPKVTDKEGKQFVGWNEPIAKYMPESDLVYYAVYNEQLLKTITVSANNDNYGSVTLSSRKVAGSNFTIIATPNEHYYFSRWEKNGRTVSTNSVFTILVTEDETYTAIFTPETYIIRANSTGSGYVEINGFKTSGGNFEYEPNRTVELTAIGEDGYTFDKWSDGNTDNPRYVPVTQDGTYTAEFTTAYHTVIAASNGLNMGYATVNKTTQVRVSHGSTVTLRALAATGYEFKGWYANGIFEYNYERERYGVVVTQDVTYTAEFGELNNVIVSGTINEPGVGTISGQGFGWNSSTNRGSGSYKEGQTVTLTANANPGNEFYRWSYDSSKIYNVTERFNTITFTIAPTDSESSTIAITAYFSGEVYPISASSNPDSVCTISIQPDSVSYNGSSTLTISNIQSGYTFVGWYYAGELVSTSTTYLATEIKEVRHYIAQFTQGSTDDPTNVTIAVRAEDTQNSKISTSSPISLAWISYNGNKAAQYSVPIGASVALKTKLDDSTWKFVMWMRAVSQSHYEMIPSGSNGEIVISSVSSSDEGGYSAIFTKRPYYIQCTYGTASVGQNSGYYVYGESVSITPNTRSGYTFDHWEVDGAAVSSGYEYTISGNNILSFTINSYTASSDDSNPVVYTAVYNQDSQQYTGTVSTSVYPSGSGSVSGGGSYTQGLTVTLRVTNTGSGYNFKQWNKGSYQGQKVSESSEYSFEFSQSTEGTYTAIFELTGGDTPAETPSYYYSNSATNVLNIDNLQNSVPAADIINLNTTTQRNSGVTQSFQISGVVGDVFYILYKTGYTCNVSVMQNGIPYEPAWTSVAKTYDGENYTLRYFYVPGNFEIRSITYNLIQ